MGKSKKIKFSILSIDIPLNVKHIPIEYKSLTDEVNGFISIEHNKNIKSITNFTNLTHVGGELEIRYCNLLENITGFSKLNRIDGALRIDDNDVLVKIPEFDSLQKIKELNINSNPLLSDIFGFNKLNTIDYDIRICDNKSITQINGFNELCSDVTYINIENNESLTQIVGFSKFKNKETSICIRKNPKLVAMSIPGNLIRVICDDNKSYLEDDMFRFDYDSYFGNAIDFINSHIMFFDFISKFNPGYHGDLVVKQILENVVEWGSDETKDKVISHLVSKGVKHLIPSELLNKYHTETIKFNNEIIMDDIYAD